MPKGREMIILEPKLELVSSDSQTPHTFSLCPYKSKIKTHTAVTQYLYPSILLFRSKESYTHGADQAFARLCGIKALFKKVCVHTWQLFLWVSNEVWSVLTPVSSMLQQH